MSNIVKAVQLKMELDELRPLKKEDELRIMQKFRLDWNYHSNHLEGNSLTYGETKALILFGITAQGKPLKDHFEITGHNEAIKWVEEIVQQDRPITESFIRELHKLLLKESYQSPAITPDGQPTTKTIKVGEYKSQPNHVKTITGEIYRFATPEETPAKMQDLITWYREKQENPETQPILLAAEFHYRFIQIHPFDDGNGRTARILMNLILMQQGYPPVIIKTEDKENYFAALRQADAGILSAFVEYIAENLVHSLELMIRGAKGESVEEEGDLDKEIALLEQRLNEMSEPIKIFKNKESLTALFQNSFGDLIKQFLNKNKVFERFYTESKNVIFIDNFGDGVVDYKISSNVLNRISDKTSEASISIVFNTFNRAGFNGFDFNSAIHFKFYKTYYEIRNNKMHTDFNYRKLYSQNLTQEEIAYLVDIEIKRHKNFIEQKIAEKSNPS